MFNYHCYLNAFVCICWSYHLSFQNWLVCETFCVNVNTLRVSFLFSFTQILFCILFNICENIILTFMLNGRQRKIGIDSNKTKKGKLINPVINRCMYSALWLLYTVVPCGCSVLLNCLCCWEGIYYGMVVCWIYVMLMY